MGSDVTSALSIAKNKLLFDCTYIMQQYRGNFMVAAKEAFAFLVDVLKRIEAAAPPGTTEDEMAHVITQLRGNILMICRVTALRNN